jgi:glycosyltransferase involved in cell wall biosynthesis
MNKFYQKKIAIISPYYLPADLSGAEIVNQQIAEFFGEKNCVHLITSDSRRVRYFADLIKNDNIKKKGEILNRVKIIRLKHNKYLAFIKYVTYKVLQLFPNLKITKYFEISAYGPQINQRQLSNLLNEEEYDLIYSVLPHYLNVQLIRTISSLKKTPKLIIRPDLNFVLPVYKNSLIKKILDKVDLVHAITLSEKNLINRYYSISLNRIFVVNNSLDLNRYEQSLPIEKQVNTIKNKYHLFNKKIILFVGNKNYDKGAFSVVLASKKLYKKDKNISLITMGYGDKKWEIFSKKYKETFLIDLPYSKEVVKKTFYRLCDVYCMPSQADAFGLSFLEAWQAKKPVIGAITPMAKELIEENSAGYCVKFNNIDQLAEKINKLINNKLLSKKIGTNGYFALINKYNFKITQKQLSDKFFELLS